MDYKQLKTLKLEINPVKKAYLEINGENITDRTSGVDITFINGRWDVRLTTDSFWRKGILDELTENKNAVKEAQNEN